MSGLLGTLVIILVAEDSSWLHLSPHVAGVFCFAALAIQKDRSRLQAGVGWEQTKKVHASHRALFLVLTSPFFL